MMTSGKFHLERGGRSVARAPPHGLLECLDHPRVGVAQDQRTPGKDVVHIAVAVDVVEIRALSPLHEARRSAHRAKGTHRAVDPTRHQPLRVRPEPFRFRDVHSALLCRLFQSLDHLDGRHLALVHTIRQAHPPVGTPGDPNTRGQSPFDGLHPPQVLDVVLRIGPVPPIDAMEQGLLR